MLGRQTGVITLVDERVSRFDVPGKEPRIEQGGRESMVRQFLPDAGQAPRIGGKLDDQLHELFWIGGNELRQVYGLQQTCGHPPGERLSEAGHHGQAHPKRLAGGGMSIVG